jgi:hypothetical protein
MDRQEPLPDAPVTRRVRVFCQGLRANGRRCGRELTDELSRSRRLGPECDPDTRAGHQRRDADQEPIPGL